MLVRTFDTFDIIIVPGNYRELVGSIFLLLPLLYINNYWVSAPSRIWPHLTEILSNLIRRTSGRVVAGFAGTILVFWNFVLPLNEYGLLPFRFPVTRHISITLAVSIGLWGGLILFGTVRSYRLTLAHLLPRNVGVLGPFIILVELISSLVRPISCQHDCWSCYFIFGCRFIYDINFDGRMMKSNCACCLFILWSPYLLSTSLCIFITNYLL